MTTAVKICKDCVEQFSDVDGVMTKTRPAPYPGPRCATHHRAKKKATGERNAEKRWAANYGITPEQYKAILAAQDGGCGFCGRPQRKGGRRLAVDHDHACCSGKKSCGKCVRGLLCWSCNKFSEHINDNPVVVARMARYYQFPPAKLIREA
jgi:hypothetical protein